MTNPSPPRIFGRMSRWLRNSISQHRVSSANPELFLACFPELQWSRFLLFSTINAWCPVVVTTKWLPTQLNLNTFREEKYLCNLPSRTKRYSEVKVKIICGRVLLWKCDFVGLFCTRCRSCWFSEVRLKLESSRNFNLLVCELRAQLDLNSVGYPSWGNK